MIKEKSCGCIIIEDNRVLLVKHQKGHWGFPKGHVEENETEMETAIREVKEETNLDVEIVDNKRYTEEYITDKGNEKEVVYFYAKKIGGEIYSQEEEVSETKWFSFEDALQIITYKESKETFRKFLEENNFKIEKRMNKEELIKLIESLEIDYEEFWILSSSALLLRDLFPDAGDLDIAVTEKGLEQLKKKYNLKQKANGWYQVNDKIECVVDTKEPWKIEKIGKYNVQSLEKYLEFLKMSNREKDKVRIELVEKALEMKKRD